MTVRRSMFLSGGSMGTHRSDAACHPKKMAYSAEKSEKKFFSGVGILTGAALVSKIIGLFYRIPLVSAIGIGSMAYFLAANHIYVTLYLIASAGLPLAVSILVAQRQAMGDSLGATRVYRTALLLFLILGGAGSLFLFFGADFISLRIGLAGAALCLKAIAPTLLFSCISAAIRGYFQGFEKMAPTAVSEVIESSGKLVFGLFLARYAVSRGYSAAVCAAFAVAGLTLGVFLSMLYLVLMKLGFSPEIPIGEHIEENEGRGHEQGSSFVRILRIAAPVTASSVVLSVASVVDTVLISGRLQDAGFEIHLAETMYSCYGNLTLPLFNLPSSLLTPISLALVPLLSAALRAGKKEDERTVVTSAIRITALLAIPASMGLSVFAQPILTLLYPREETAVSIAAPLLSFLALSILFSSFMTVTNAILTTYGRPSRALLSMSIGAMIKIGLEYILVGNPDVNIYGAPISTFCCNLAVTLLNLSFVYRDCAGCESIGAVFGKPFASSLVSVGIAGGVYALLIGTGGFSPWKLLFSLFVAVFCYLFVGVCGGAIRRQDVEAMPMGDRLARLLFPQRKGKKIYS